MPAQLLRLLLYALAVIALVAAVLGLSWMMGERHRERETGTPYESGMPLTGSARLRFTVRYYLVAMLFVLFDLEAAFLVTWGVSARHLGWPGFAAASAFALLLAVGLVYEWRVGALDFGPPGRTPGRSERGEEVDER